jgi:hypothetical protein
MKYKTLGLTVAAVGFLALRRKELSQNQVQREVFELNEFCEN